VNENPDGILGNLPRSRPGVRSEKRAAGVKPRAMTAKPAAAKSKPAAAKANPAATKPRAPKTAAPKAAAPKAQPAPDGLERAVQLVGDVAETGIKVVAKVAGGVLRRLPRP
jgi:hypothetical protein